MEFVGKSTNGIQLLDMQHIPEMTTVERIAYVYDVSLGVSKLEDGFVKFFLKDCNAAVTAAVMFNVEKFFESGMKASAFKGKPIRFKCMAQEFNGRLSLVIDGNYGVSIYDGPFEYERFIGKLDSDVVSVQAELGKLEPGIEFIIDPEWNMLSLEKVGKGRVGAYAKMVELAYAYLKHTDGLMSDEDYKVLLSVFSDVSDFYFRFLKKEQAVEVIGSLHAYPLMNQLSQKRMNDGNRVVYLDALGAVIGADSPKHLIAHLIKDAFNAARHTVELSVQFQTMPIGTKSFIGGVAISKY